jgi:Cu/Ag efflux pump CusA
LLGVVLARRLVVRPEPPLRTTVTTRAPGLSSEHVETEVTIPLERGLMAIPDLERIESSSRSGESRIELVFRPRAEPWDQRRSVLEAISAASRMLPPSISLPELAPPASRAALFFALETDALSSPEVRAIADDGLRPGLLGVPGVADVEAWGGGLRETRVIVDAPRLSAYGLTVSDVAAALAKAEGDGAALSDLVVATRDSATIFVRDLAVVVDGAAPAGVALHAGRRVVLAAVRLRDEDAAPAARQKLDALARELPRSVQLSTLGPAVAVRLHAPEQLALEKLNEAVARCPGVRDLALRSADGETELVVVPDPATRDVLASVAATIAPLGVVTEHDAVSFRIHGEDLEALTGMATRLRGELLSVPGVSALAFEGLASAPEVEVVPDRAKLAACGAARADVALAIEAATTGRAVGQLVDRASGRRRPIVLRIGHDPSPDALETLHVRASTGALVPLSSVAELRRALARAEIHRVNGRRCIRAIANVDANDREKTAELLRRTIAERLGRGLALERER